MQTLIIQYIRWGGSFHDRAHMWCAHWEETGEAWDYGSKKYLVSEAKKHNLKFKVIRWHRDGTKSVVETNNSKTEAHETDNNDRI